MSEQLLSAAARLSAQVWMVDASAVPGYFAGLVRGDLASAASSSGGGSVSIVGDVAVVTIDGVMVPEAVYAGEVGTLPLARQINGLRTRNSVAAVVLRINSPGGVARGVSELTQAIANLSREKPVLAQVEQACCSAAYMAASQAGAIYAGPRDDVGSIGVRTLVYDMSEMFAKAGVEAVSVATGPLKDFAVEGLAVTDEQKAAMRERVGLLFEDFKAAVQRGRSMNDQNFAAVATGRVWYGEQAVGLGLVDGVQDFAATLGSVGVAA